MLIILPPSETKRPPPATGERLDLRTLAFPALNPVRTRVMRAILETSAAPDALRRLRVRPGLIRDVLLNLDLRESPTQPAWLLYSGPLYQGLAPDSLSAAAVKRATTRLVIASALFGATRPTDLLPFHRLNLHSHLVGLDRLEPLWRTVLPQALTDAAGPRGLVLDLRSPPYQAIGSPADAHDRTVTVRVLPPPGERTVGDVIAKRVRGQIAHHLLESRGEPLMPDDLADALADRFSVRLDPPSPGQPWTLKVRPTD